LLLWNVVGFEPPGVWQEIGKRARVASAEDARLEVLGRLNSLMINLVSAFCYDYDEPSVSIRTLNFLYFRSRACVAFIRFWG
jgi:hypothetical protein